MVTVQTGHPGERPSPTPLQGRSLCPHSPRLHTPSVLFVFSLPPPPPPPHPTPHIQPGCLKTIVVRRCHLICFHFLLYKEEARTSGKIAMNNERTPHSCSGIYIFPAVERDGSQRSSGLAPGSPSSVTPGAGEGGEVSLWMYLGSEVTGQG